MLFYDMGTKSNKVDMRKIIRWEADQTGKDFNWIGFYPELCHHV